MASKARNPQEYVWLSPDKAGFADQPNAFCVLINDPVAANIMAGDIKDNESALKMPGVPDGAKLKELVFKLVTQLAQSVKATRSSDEIRGPMLAPLKDAMAAMEFSVATVLGLRMSLERCFGGTIIVHMNTAFQRVLSLSYSPEKGMSNFLHQLDERVTALEILLNRAYNRKKLDFPAALLYSVFDTAPPEVMRVVHKFFSPLDDPSKTTRESIEGVDLPALATELRSVLPQSLLAPQPRRSAQAASRPAQASLPSVEVNSVKQGGASKLYCEFHKSSSHALDKCKHYKAYRKAGHPACGKPGADAAITAYKAKFRGSGSSSKAYSSNTFSMRPSHHVVSINSSGKSAAASASAVRVGIDTHTTSHIVQDPNLLHDVELYDSPRPVFSLNDEPREDVTIVGHGDLVLRFHPKGVQAYTVTLRGVLLAESSSPDKGLILLKALSFSGTEQLPIYITTAAPARLVFREDDGSDASSIELETGTGQFFVAASDVTVIKPSNAGAAPTVNSIAGSVSESLARINNRKVDKQVWHERLGHVNHTRVSKELKDQGISPAPGDVPGICGPCAFKASATPILSSAQSKKRKRKRKRGKSAAATAAAAPTQPAVVANDVSVDEPTVSGLVKGEQVHGSDTPSTPVEVDVRQPGQITVADIKFQKIPSGGTAMWLVMIDAATNHAHVEHLTTKSSANVCTAINNYLTSFGMYIRRGDFFHFDSEATLLSAETTEFLMRNGQRPLVTAASPPYTQQLNGKVERIAGIINKMADCMFSRLTSMVKFLEPAHLDKLALLSLKHAADVHNRLPPSSGGKSPVELLTGRLVPHDELRVFGSPSYIHYDKAQAALQGRKVEPGIHVGYSSVNTSHAIFCPRTGSVRHSINVDIDEQFKTVAFLKGQLGLEPSDLDDAATSIDHQGVGDEEHLPLPPVPLTSTNTRVNTTVIGYKNDSFRFPLPALTPSSEHSVFVNATNASRKMPMKVATSPQYKDLFDAALQAEVQSFRDNNVFASLHSASELDRYAAARGFTKVSLNLLCSEKFDEVGDLDRLKARAVADGSKQGAVNHDGAYVMRASSSRMIASKAAQDGYILVQGDFKTAFLYTPIQNAYVFVRLPDEFMRAYGTDKRYARLAKTIYGLKEASAEWYHHLAAFLRSHGFTSLKSDPCVFKAPVAFGPETIVGIATDDLMVAVDTNEHWQAMLALLNTEFIVKDLGPLKWYLGVAYEQDLEASTVSLSQSKYIENLAEEYGVINSRRVGTVMPDVLPTVAHIAITSEELKASATRPYRQLLGSMNFVATNTRPDIAMAISYLSTFGRAHGRLHYDAALHVLRYLYFTREDKLTYTYSSDSVPNDMQIYTDSGYASTDPLCQSGQYSGHVAILNGGAVSWKARRTDAKLSTAEAEYVALCYGGREASHAKQFLQEILGRQLHAPVVIHCDNKAAVSIAKSESVTQLNKHFDIKLHWIRDKIKSKWFDVQHIDTKSQAADILTKNLPAHAVKYQRALVLGLSG